MTKEKQMKPAPENPDDTPPIIGEFKVDQPLILTRFPNGGWVITQQVDFRVEDVGAYGSAEEMLDALRWLLV